MNGDNVAQRLLLRSLIALLVCAALVAVCYFFVDRPVAFFVHDHDISRHEVLKWLQDPPGYADSWAPLVLAALAIRRAFGQFQRWELTLLVACVSLLVAVQFKDSLKFAFGRYWPTTWINDNPSLIGDGAYGFHPFAEEGSSKEFGWYGSFPSGHMTRTLAIVAVYWVAYPRWRWLGSAATLAVAVGLIGKNYHFVGDVVAGSFTGAILGVYAAYCGGLDASASGRNGRINRS